MARTYNEVQPAVLGQKKRKRDGAREHTPATDQPAPQAAWPQALQDFVNNLFARAETLDAVRKQQFTEQINAVIFAAARDNKLWTNSWAHQKLPVFDPLATLALHQDVPVPQVVAPGTPSYDSRERKKQRAARFAGAGRGSPSPVPGSLRSERIVGTLDALEKRYLRLTSEPDPAAVRPEAMLRRCLGFVVDKFRLGSLQYLYINDQLKAIRQDMTVQHITNDLAVKVYETHGRIAIENNDMGEFNQCVSQLKHLYAALPKDSFPQTYEFTCYRILYLLLTGNLADINLVRLELLRADKSPGSLPQPHDLQRKCVYRSLKVLEDVMLGNYAGFFAAYRWFQGLDSMQCAFHLMDQYMATKQRLLALNAMTRAFKKLPVDYIERELALGAYETPDHEMGVLGFLAQYNMRQFVGAGDFDCSAARGILQQIVDQGQFKRIDIKGQI